MLTVEVVYDQPAGVPRFNPCSSRMSDRSPHEGFVSRHYIYTFLVLSKCTFLVMNSTPHETDRRLTL